MTLQWNLKLTGCDTAKCKEASQNTVKLRDSSDNTSTIERSSASVSVMVSRLVGCCNRQSVLKAGYPLYIESITTVRIDFSFYVNYYSISLYQPTPFKNQLQKFPKRKNSDFLPNCNASASRSWHSAVFPSRIPFLLFYQLSRISRLNSLYFYLCPTQRNYNSEGVAFFRPAKKPRIQLHTQIMYMCTHT